MPANETARLSELPMEEAEASVGADSGVVDAGMFAMEGDPVAGSLVVDVVATTVNEKRP